jgi:hypothetical protein
MPQIVPEIGVTTERPDFGETQIKELRHLRPNLKVVLMPENTNFKIFGKPFKDKGILYIHVLNLDTGNPKTLSLPDCGMVPYPNGKWNAANWFSKII